MSYACRRQSAQCRASGSCCRCNTRDRGEFIDRRSLGPDRIRWVEHRDCSLPAQQKNCACQSWRLDSIQRPYRYFRCRRNSRPGRPHPLKTLRSTFLYMRSRTRASQKPWTADLVSRIICCSRDAHGERRTRTFRAGLHNGRSGGTNAHLSARFAGGHQSTSSLFFEWPSKTVHGA